MYAARMLTSRKKKIIITISMILGVPILACLGYIIHLRLRLLHAETLTGKAWIFAMPCKGIHTGEAYCYHYSTNITINTSCWEDCKAVEEAVMMFEQIKSDALNVMLETTKFDSMLSLMRKENVQVLKCSFTRKAMVGSEAILV